MHKKDPHKQLGAALGKIPSGLFVVTVRQGEAETGMLASWVQQCSFEPPQITLAVRRGRGIADWLKDGVSFTLNILDATETDMIVHFGRGFAPGEPAFEGLDIEHPDGAPAVLTDALAYLHCRVESRFPAGDHDLFLGQVLGGRLLGANQPMVHVRKSGFHY